MKEDPETRSRIMRSVRSKDTGPEMIVRRIAHGMGYRFRLHREDLPGRPDLVFPKYRKIIFVHGCFWHGHGCARGARVPKTNREYWLQKIARNVARDKAFRMALKQIGWDSLVLWECRLNDPSRTAEHIQRFLASP